MEESAVRPSVAARITAGLVFLLGVLLMAGTFYMAYTMFQDPNALLQPAPTQGQPTVDLGRQGLLLVVRIGLLFIMAYAGSSIAAKGIALYEATHHHPES